MEYNPKVLEEVEKAIYQARWVDAFGKNSVLATDEVLAEAATEAIFKYLKGQFA